MGALIEGKNESRREGRSAGSRFVIVTYYYLTAALISIGDPVGALSVLLALATGVKITLTLISKLAGGAARYVASRALL